MKILSRSRARGATLLLSLAASLLLALAFAGGAMATTQDIGPYQVTDEVTQGGTAAEPTTTATYTISVPDEAAALALLAGAGPAVQDISHVTVGVCNDLADRTYLVQRQTESDLAPVNDPQGSFDASGDPSIPDATGAVVKWDNSQATGTTVKYIYTVPGHWDSTPTTLWIKSGSTFSGTVQGIACANTPPPPPPPPTVNPPGPTSQPPAQQPPPAQQQVQGEQHVAGERVVRGSARIAGASGCQRKAFKVSVRGKQIRKVVFRIDGKRVKAVRKSASGKVYSITVRPNRYKPGSHVVSAHVSFTTASDTRSKTLRARFARCVRQVAPSFTG